MVRPGERTKGHDTSDTTTAGDPDTSLEEHTAFDEDFSQLEVGYGNLSPSETFCGS